MEQNVLDMVTSPTPKKKRIILKIFFTIIGLTVLGYFLPNILGLFFRDIEPIDDSDLRLQKITIPDVVFPELEYVLLGKSYNATRTKILKAFEFLATQKNVNVSPIIKKSMDLYKKTSLDMADCIIVATSLDNQLLSFDKKLKRDLTVAFSQGFFSKYYSFF